ncbi:MAG: ThiF family adenylyltransferase, partial [Candidatus Obscuribacterales bacterium]|nr:ThiF family adenylyltransferase [Candidatus Obscuribacterales bacterium]
VCFIAGTPSYAHRVPEKVLKWVLDQAIRTLSISDEDAAAEFINEFQAYWDRENTGDEQISLVLLSAKAPTRRIFYRNTKSFLLLAEDSKTLKKWLGNNGIETKFEAEVGLFIWLDEAVPPHAIPATSREFASFLKARDSRAYEMLVNHLPRKKGSLPVLIGFNTESGVALATVVLHEPIDTVAPNKARSCVQNGWSSREKMPATLLAANYLGNAKLSRLPTRRFDKEWLDFRTGNVNSSRLSEAHVCLIGCGALGSNLAYILARAGVGRLTLIDGDILTWDNVGRHLLGAEYVGLTKEFALRKFIGKQLPHLDIECLPGKWQDIYETSPSAILNASVIVSTTGDWACDEMLNLVARTTTAMPPVLFGWLEEFGSAGQALAVLEEGGCLACGMTAVGRFKHAATTWTESTLRSAGACGQLFQPFGITELGPVTDMLARLTIDVLLGKVAQSELRSWLGEQSIVNDNNGRYSDSVVPMFADSQHELANDVKSWTCDPSCHLCRTAS